jgi:hypothetical protein
VIYRAHNHDMFDMPDLDEVVRAGAINCTALLSTRRPFQFEVAT